MEFSSAASSPALERLQKCLRAQTRDTGRSANNRTELLFLLRECFTEVRRFSDIDDSGSPSVAVGGGAHNFSSSSVSAIETRNARLRCMQGIYAILVGDDFAAPKHRLLCAGLLREMSNGTLPNFFVENFAGDFSGYEERSLVYLIALLCELATDPILRVNKGNALMWMHDAQQGLSSKGGDDLSNFSIMPLKCLWEKEAKNREEGVGGGLFFEDDELTIIEKCLEESLTKSAQTTEVVNQTLLFSVRLLSSNRKNSFLVLEPDGSENRDFFTCMNTTDFYSPHLVRTVFHFSHLYSYITSIYYRSSKNQKRTLSARFADTTATHCLRLLAQVELQNTVTERTAVSGFNLKITSGLMALEEEWAARFADCVSSEALRILDILCLLDTSLVSRVFPAVKRLHERTTSRKTSHVFSSILQFVLNHHQQVIFDLEPVLGAFFVDHIACQCRDVLLARTAMQFLTTNAQVLLAKASSFARYLPAILKLVASHPRALASEMCEILPAVSNAQTFESLFHSLLDLPSVSSLIEKKVDNRFIRELSHATVPPSNNHNFFSSSSRPPGMKRCSVRTIQWHLLRNDTSLPTIWEMGDAEQTSLLLYFWQTMAVTPRVSYTCKVVPRLLQIYFDVVLADAPIGAIDTLLRLILMRFSTIFPVEFFRVETRKVIIDTLLKIFGKQPALLFTMKEAIIDALSAAQLNAQGVLLIEHLCWIVGNYCRRDSLVEVIPGETERTKTILTLFGAIENLAYQTMMTLDFPTNRNRDGLAAVASTNENGLPLRESSSSEHRHSSCAHSTAQLGGGAGSLAAMDSRKLLEMSVDHRRAAIPASSAPAAHDGGASGGNSTTLLEGCDGGGILGQAQQDAACNFSAATHHYGSVSSIAIDNRGTPPSHEIVSAELVAVVIAALTKMAVEFPECGPKTICCLIKMLHFFQDCAIVDRLHESLRLLSLRGMATSFLATTCKMNDNNCKDALETICKGENAQCEFIVGTSPFHRCEFPLTATVTAPTEQFEASLFDSKNARLSSTK